MTSAVYPSHILDQKPSIVAIAIGSKRSWSVSPLRRGVATWRKVIWLRKIIALRQRCSNWNGNWQCGMRTSNDVVWRYSGNNVLFRLGGKGCGIVAIL